MTGADWASGIPWAIAVAGWAATHVFSEARERRKECRSQLDKVHELLAKIELGGTAFHRAEKYDGVKSGELLSQLHQLERTLYRIPVLNVDGLARDLVRLRRSITLKNFDASEFVTQHQGGDVIAGISDAVFDMEDALEMQYRELYPAKFPFFRFGRRRTLGHGESSQ